MSTMLARTIVVMADVALQARRRNAASPLSGLYQLVALLSVGSLISFVLNFGREGF